MTLAKSTGDLDKLLDRTGISIQDVLDALAATKERAKVTAAVQSGQLQKVTLPAPVPISDEQRRALRTIATMIDTTPVPTTARKLRQPEQDTFVALYIRLKKAAAVLSAAEETYKEVFRNHLDCQLESDLDPTQLAQVPISVTDTGTQHYIAPGEIVPTDQDQKITRETKGGKARPLTRQDLDALLNDGDITPAQYKVMTYQVPRKVIAAHREISPEGIMRAVQDDHTLLLALSKVAELTPQTTSVQLRPNKIKK